jgi:hypothetical protein
MPGSYPFETYQLSVAWPWLDINRDDYPVRRAAKTIFTSIREATSFNETS